MKLAFIPGSKEFKKTQYFYDLKSMTKAGRKEYLDFGLGDFTPHVETLAICINLEKKEPKSVHFDELFDSQFAPAPAMH